jgi:hypothetical protein
VERRDDSLAVDIGHVVERLVPRDASPLLCALRRLAD